MTKFNISYSVDGIDFRVVFSARRTIGLSVLPDASVVVRAPYFTSGSTIERIIRQKSDWIIKHRDNYRDNPQEPRGKKFTDGETHFFRGGEYRLTCVFSQKPYLKLYGNIMEAGIPSFDDRTALARLVEKWYREEANRNLPLIFSSVLQNFGHYGFRPAGLIIRSLKRRWGSCSSKGIITLSSGLIKLPDRLIEYVVLHELCHLKHHNHGPEYYRLLGEVYPDYKQARKDMKKYIP